MSKLVEYYSNNQEENPYTMEGTKRSSRVEYIKDFIVERTPKGGNILDVGCGDMYLSRILPDYEWEGLDANNVSNNAKCVKHDIESFPYPVSKMYDTIICSEVLEHVFDPIAVTKEIHRLLKPNGNYILSTPNFDWIEHFTTYFRPVIFNPTQSWTKEHIHFYTVEAHEDILKLAGFKLDFFTGGDPHFGTFFQRARGVFTKYVETVTETNREDAIAVADKLISESFKRFSHTLVMIAKKV